MAIADNNVGIIRRATIENKFAQIPNSVSRDDNMTWGARGLLVYLLSLPNDWVVRKTHLLKQAPDGKYKFENYFNELIKKGYLLPIEIRDSMGRFKGSSYIAYQYPFNDESLATKDFTPQAVLSATDFTVSGKSATTNKELNTNKEKSTKEKEKNEKNPEKNIPDSESEKKSLQTPFLKKENPPVPQPPQNEVAKTSKDEEIKQKTKLFLQLFNKVKAKQGSREVRTLSTTAYNNLNKLVEAGYKAEDFVKAITEMLKSDWAKTSGNQTPAHVLRVDNFEKYLNLSTDENTVKPFNPSDLWQ